MSYQEEKLQAIADAIRSKKGTTEPIKASDFATEILGLSDGADAKPEVGIIITPTKEQQVVTPTGNNVFNEVTVNAIPDEYIIPEGTLEITENGTSDVTNYATVVTNVAGSGGGGNEDFIAFVEGTTTELNIPSGTTTIGDNAFYYNRNLTKVNIPEGVTTIGGYAFYNNSKLEVVNMPDSLIDISSNAFQTCSAMKTITLPKNIDHLRTSCFDGCRYVEELNYNIIALGYSINSGYPPFKSLGSNSTGVVVNIGEDVERLPGYLFSGGNSSAQVIKINTINFPTNSKCTKLGEYCFYNCKTGTFNINWNGAYNTITEFGQGLFRSNQGFTSITIPLGVTEIPSDCFRDSGLTSVEMHDNITHLGSNSFRSCTGLIKLVMPSKLTNIYSSAFYQCSNIVTYDFTKCEAIPTLGMSAFGSTSANRKIYVPDALYDQWIVATNWVDQASYIFKASEMPTE